jgi:hypothetical protein
MCIELDEDHYRLLDQLARDLGSSKAWIIRRGIIEIYLKTRTPHGALLTKLSNDLIVDTWDLVCVAMDTLVIQLSAHFTQLKINNPTERMVLAKLRGWLFDTNYREWYLRVRHSGAGSELPRLQTFPLHWIAFTNDKQQKDDRKNECLVQRPPH